ncbi:hypothetical protein CLAVI_000889 [Candidatus Clavichlamydia salmonicola]|uniref:hypothetical protein n=1 Tax=Candidatus Clavichlamydia salmonicola TaxID=469812 RepID=UPI0018914FD4|nr:hypothetical protein [Candidatus Clavichlamydia salmonicola]MBF5051248.1 hypothetical protein [Candidatus Clavichlamydia salmonicola]
MSLPINFSFPEITVRRYIKTMSIGPSVLTCTRIEEIQEVLSAIIVNIEEAAADNFLVKNAFSRSLQPIDSPFNSVTSLSELVLTLKKCLHVNKNTLVQNCGATYYQNITSSLSTVQEVINTRQRLPSFHSLIHFNFNPLFISLSILHIEKQLVMKYCNVVSSNFFFLKERLECMVEILKEGAQNGFSLRNNFPTNPVTSSSYPGNIKNIAMLVEQLQLWVQTNAPFLLKKYDSAFIYSITKSLKTIALSTPQLDSYNPFHDRSLKQNPLKRYSDSIPEATVSSSKKYKIASPLLTSRSTEHHLKEIVSPCSSKSSPSTLQSLKKSLEVKNNLSTLYRVEELTFFQSNIFIIIPIQTSDLEGWANRNHTIVGQFLNYPENILVNSPIDTQALKYETLTNLRALSLQKLLEFMAKHASFIPKIQDKTSNHEATHLHLHLTKELTNALTEVKSVNLLIKQDAHIPVIEANISMEKKEFIPVSISPSSTSEYSSSSSSTMIVSTDSSLEASKQPYLSLKISHTYFDVIIISGFQTSNHFRAFTKQIKKASLLLNCNFKVTIPGISKIIFNNSLKILTLLYYLVSRNLYLHHQNHPLNKSKSSWFLNPILNYLNETYCRKQQLIPNPLQHHQDLKKILFSNMNPPLYSCESTNYITYKSIYLQKHTTNIFLIRNKSLQSPINKTPIDNKYFLQSMKDHNSRLKALSLLNSKQPVWVKCLDESWALIHKQNYTIPACQLHEIALNISKYNYTECLKHFKIFTTTGEEDWHPGYEQTKQYLSSAIEIFNTSLLKAQSCPSITHPKKKAKISSRLKKPRPTLTTIISFSKSGDYYNLIEASITSKRRHHISSFFLKNSFRLKKFVFHIISADKFCKIHNQEQAMTNKKDCICLLYHGILLNISLVRAHFEGAFRTVNESLLKKKYNKILKNLYDAQLFLQKTWNTEIPQLPIPSIETINHPFTTNLKAIHQAIQSITIDSHDNEVP